MNSVSAMFLFLSVGCSQNASQSKAPQLAPTPVKPIVEAPPSWITAPPELCVVGSSQHSEYDKEPAVLHIQAATERARAKLSQLIEVKVTNKVKEYAPGEASDSRDRLDAKAQQGFDELKETVSQELSHQRLTGVMVRSIYRVDSQTDVLLCIDPQPIVEEGVCLPPNCPRAAAAPKHSELLTAADSAFSSLGANADLSAVAKSNGISVISTVSKTTPPLQVTGGISVHALSPRYNWSLQVTPAAENKEQSAPQVKSTQVDTAHATAACLVTALAELAAAFDVDETSMVKDYDSEVDKSASDTLHSQVSKAIVNHSFGSAALPLRVNQLAKEYSEHGKVEGKAVQESMFTSATKLEVSETLLGAPSLRVLGEVGFADDQHFSSYTAELEGGGTVSAKQLNRLIHYLNAVGISVSELAVDADAVACTLRISSS